MSSQDKGIWRKCDLYSTFYAEYSSKALSIFMEKITFVNLNVGKTIFLFKAESNTEYVTGLYVQNLSVF